MLSINTLKYKNTDYTSDNAADVPHVFPICSHFGDLRNHMPRCRLLFKAQSYHAGSHHSDTCGIVATLHSKHPVDCEVQAPSFVFHGGARGLLVRHTLCGMTTLYFVAKFDTQTGKVGGRQIMNETKSKSNTPLPPASLTKSYRLELPRPRWAVETFLSWYVRSDTSLL